MTQVHKLLACLKRGLEKSHRLKKLSTNNRRFVGAGDQNLEHVGVYHMLCTWTNKKDKSITVTQEVEHVKVLQI
jgi:hypothetical protein